MACDIHVMIEKVNKENGEWDTYLEGNEGFYLHIDRNYDLFAILADVRNGYGFARCDTGDGFVPIARPRGIPNNASDNYLDYVKEWGSDGHSHSCLTVREIQNFDWDGQTTKHRGYVSQESYALYKQTGEIRCFSADVCRRDICKVSNEIMDYILSGAFPKGKNADYYTQIEWEETYKESCAYFVNNQLPELVKLAKDCNCSTEELRLVFFFDN
ncbi:hypothetical protein HCA69_15455 [Listeria grandensis]|uniref:Uncharacterized protein n=1 Tax=Listeria grandensis TaxID=1494963 RepID=A0A7X1CR64_9LIST|nr:hypothetical protein [Listeria grandensis]MBC1937765.1 hypothetical protein [Listeria grandensis]